MSRTKRTTPVKSKSKDKGTRDQKKLDTLLKQERKDSMEAIKISLVTDKDPLFQPSQIDPVYRTSKE